MKRDAIAAVQADVVVESSGSHRGLASAIQGAVRGGKVVMVGLLQSGPQPVLISLAITRELELLGSFRFNDEIDDVIEALADGSLFVDPVITHVFPLERGLEAFETARNSAESGKVLLSFAPEDTMSEPFNAEETSMTVEIPPMVVMGLSGSGKSVLGAALGQSLGIPFIDADDLHPATNKALMAAGTPLTDADRMPWLNVVAAAIAQGVSEGHPSVVACSALKRSYRDLIRSQVPDLLLIYIDGEAEIIERRLETREHEFMPATLLASQLATLEPPQADEKHLRVPAELTVEEAVELVRSTLDLTADAPPN